MGDYPVIFVTVGTTRFPFDRLLKAVDKAVANFRGGGKLVIQKGTAHYRFKYPNAEITSELTFEKMIHYFKKAKVVICHGGPTTVFLALKYGQNKPLVVPRSKKFGEHVDDHQIIFVKFLKKRGLAEAIFPNENLVLKIVKYLSRPEKLKERKKLLPSRRLIEKLTSYTKNIK